MRRLCDFITTRSLFVLLLLTLRGWSSVNAVLVNETIDDDGVDFITGSKITYSPLDLWNRGQNCSRCSAHPDPSIAFKHTWHDGTFKPETNPSPLNATFQFEGQL